ncbi:MAG: hypothetical protein AABX07_04330, partial [Nanoarchaeota archaeon]
YNQSTLINSGGTAGYIPQFQSAGILNNSVIFQKGAFIGIGAVAPGAELQVNGTSTTVTDPIVKIVSTGAQVPLYFTSGAGDAYIKGDSGGNFAMGAEGFIAFEAGGFGNTFERMQVTSTGLVGIGTSTPSNKLDVRGDINASASIYANNGTVVINATTGSFWYNQTIAANLTLYNQYGKWWYNQTSPLMVWAYNQSTLINSGGTAGYIPQFQSAGILNNSVIFQQGASVGIGTTGPSTKLHIKETTAGTLNRLEIEHSDNTNAASGANLYLLTGGTSGGDPIVQWAVSGVGYQYVAGIDSAGSGNFALSPGTTLSNHFTMSSTGNVGIGTTTPYTRMVIEGVYNTTLAGEKGLDIFGRSAGWQVGDMVGINFRHFGGDYPTYSPDASIGVVMTSAVGAELGDFFIATRPTTGVGDALLERMRITSGGNVGIGTTTPTYKLDVAGNVSLNNTLYVTNAGNVGIGTTAPTHTLNVVGGANITL